MMTYFLSSMVPFPEFLPFAIVGISAEADILSLAHPVDAVISPIPSVAVLLLFYQLCQQALPLHK